MSGPVDDEKAKLRALVAEAANALGGPTSRCLCRACAASRSAGVWMIGPCLVKLSEKLKEAVR